jgi:hypothetical protein
MKKQEPEKVSKRNIERLLKELSHERWAYDDPKVAEARQEANDHEKALLSDLKLKQLTQKKDRLEAAANKVKRKRRAKVAKVRQLYYAEGGTPRVIGMLTKLVEEENRDVAC